MIISPFNYTWFILLALAVGYIVLTTKLYKDRTEDEKLGFILKQSIILSIFWVLYKVGIGLDKTYSGFEFWNELPCFPCNTVFWLSIIACKKNMKVIMSYCFYAGIIFAMLAMVMPSPGFYDISLFSVRAIGYYITHWFVVITGIQYATFGLFNISIKSSVYAALCYLAIAAILHPINILLRATVYPQASYYYTFGSKDNSVLIKIHEMIPVNYFYLIPLAAVGILFFMLETVAIKSTGQLIRRCKDRS